MAGGDLIVQGTEGPDRILFSPGAHAGQVRVRVNGVSYGPFESPARLVANGQEGSDLIAVALGTGWRGPVMPPALFNGGAGDDVLQGHGGDDLLWGGPGADRLEGAGAQDVLVGGDDQDRLSGGAGDDVLLGGLGRDVLEGAGGSDLMLGDKAVWEDDPAVLAAICDEWASARPLAERAANLTNGTGGPRANGEVFLVLGETILPDRQRDLLVGGQDEDWLLVLEAGDRAAHVQTGLDLLGPLPRWQNAARPLDIDNDGAVTEHDLDLVREMLAATHAGGAIAELDLELDNPRRFPDVNGDNQLSHLDGLLIASFLRKQGGLGT
jgi:Ca2+-binding RTX toxin-like protein